MEVQNAVDDFDQAVAQYHLALGEFVKGSPERVKETWSQREDVMLCNPLVPFASGQKELTEALTRAASFFKEGEVTFETVARELASDFGYIVEIERFSAKLAGREELSSGALRVTTIFRFEDGTWKVVHRHADPITTPQPLESIIQM